MTTKIAGNKGPSPVGGSDAGPALETPLPGNALVYPDVVPSQNWPPARTFGIGNAFQLSSAQGALRSSGSPPPTVPMSPWALDKNSPGINGHYAFFYWGKAIDARVSRRNFVDVSMGHTKNERGDRTDGAALWFDYRAGNRASFDMSVTFESWSVSPETQALWQTPDRRGTTANDVNLGFKFMLVDQPSWALSLAGRIKFTAGQGVENRRSTDRMGGFGSIAFRKDFELQRGAGLSFMTDVGFGGWDNGNREDGLPQQDDLLRWASTLQYTSPTERWQLEAGAYGGQGEPERFNNGDRFYRLYAEAGFRVARDWTFYGNLTQSGDFNPTIPKSTTLQVGARFSFDDFHKGDKKL